MKRTPEVDYVLASFVDGPSERRLRGNDGSTIVELQTHVGNVTAPGDAREKLELYGICTDHAIFSQQRHVWERCLFSEECLRMIQELRAEGQFPFEVEAIPSQAEAEWRIVRAAGATERSPAPLRQYLLPASIETLARLQVATGEAK